MTFPLVSICIPVYNGEKTIVRAIRSVVRQTYPNLEIVVSDNGSTDNTAKLVANTFPRQNNINLIVRDRNYGAINNFRHAAENARGAYVLTLGADDELPENAVAELVNLVLESHAIAAFGRTQKINSDGPAGVITFGQYSTEQDLMRAVCSEEKINYLICGLWRTDVYRETFGKLVERFSILGASPDRLFVFFALFNYGVNYRLSDKIVYNKYYETSADRSSRPLIRSKFLSVIMAILLIRSSQRQTFLYFVFLPHWLAFQIAETFKGPLHFKNLKRSLRSWIRNNIKSEAR